MKTISLDQFSRLENASFGQFAGRLAAFLRQHYPDAAALPLEHVVAGCRSQTAKARAYAMATEWQAAVYVNTAWCMGEDFDTAFVPAKAVLNATDYTPADKARWLADWSVALIAALEAR